MNDNEETKFDSGGDDIGYGDDDYDNDDMIMTMMTLMTVIRETIAVTMVSLIPFQHTQYD